MDMSLRNDSAILRPVHDADGAHGSLAALAPETQIPRRKNILIHRLAEIQGVVIDVILYDRIDQTCNVPVLIDIVADLGGTDILQMRRQGQLNDLPTYLGFPFLIVPVTCLLLRRAFSLEHDMIHHVDGIRFRIVSIRACSFDHITADHHKQFFARKQLPQPADIRRIRDIDRLIIRENVCTDQIRARHVHDLPAVLTRLGVLGPGELVQGQIDLISGVADRGHDTLMPEGERIECTREERCLPCILNRQFPAEELIIRNESVNVVERRRVAEEPQQVALPVLDQREHFLAQDHENLCLLLQSQEIGAEHSPPQNLKCLLADDSVIIGHPHQQHPDDLPAAVCAGVLRILQNDAERVQRYRNHLFINIVQKLLQIPHDFCLLILMEFCDQDPQVFRNVS